MVVRPLEQPLPCGSPGRQWGGRFGEFHPLEPFGLPVGFDFLEHHREVTVHSLDLLLEPVQSGEEIRRKNESLLENFLHLFFLLFFFQPTHTDFNSPKQRFGRQQGKIRLVFPTKPGRFLRESPQDSLLVNL